MYPLSRRDFLKLGLLTLSTLAFDLPPRTFHPDEFDRLPLGIGRVTTTAIHIYESPNFSAMRLGQYRRDQIIILIEEINSRHGPSHNSRWYRTLEGYVHSAYVQHIEWRYNQPVSHLPAHGRLGEITIASAQSLSKIGTDDWVPRYHLYFGSLHWITDVIWGLRGSQPWYQITDDLLKVHHYVPAVYIRLLSDKEIAPISPNILPQDKRIAVSIENQTLTAFEKNTHVFHTKVATGLENKGEVPEDGFPTDTPTGRFRIGNKMPSRHMGEGELFAGPNEYEYIGVPWVCYFHESGAAFHGTFWHDNFGRRMSHGCVNMRNQDAKWLFCWTTPTLSSGEWYRIENGTVVDIE